MSAAIETPLLCHGNGRGHLWRKPAEPSQRVYATLEPRIRAAAVCPAYRVWARACWTNNCVQMGRTRDIVTFSTLITATAHCQDASVVPKSSRPELFETRRRRIFDDARYRIGWSE